MLRLDLFVGSTASRSVTTGPALSQRMLTAMRSRRVLPTRAAYPLAAATIGLATFASSTPTPLYHIYSQLWHFSPATLTLIYAMNAFGILAMLLLAGRVSDQVGRRPVLLVALATLMTSTVLYMLAGSAGWLLAARGLQGLGTGALLSAASAALLDLHPRRDADEVGLTNGVVSATGFGLWHARLLLSGPTRQRHLSCLSWCNLD